jgi:hypothetical protein
MRSPASRRAPFCSTTRSAEQLRRPGRPGSWLPPYPGRPRGRPRQRHRVSRARGCGVPGGASNTTGHFLTTCRQLIRCDPIRFLSIGPLCLRAVVPSEGQKSSRLWSLVEARGWPASSPGRERLYLDLSHVRAGSPSTRFHEPPHWCWEPCGQSNETARRLGVVDCRTAWGGGHGLGRGEYELEWTARGSTEDGVAFSGLAQIVGCETCLSARRTAAVLLRLRGRKRRDSNPQQPA